MHRGLENTFFWLGIQNNQYISRLYSRSDGTMNYPDINDLVSSQRRTGTVSRSSTTYFTQSVMLKITLSINPQTESAGKDLNKCVFELARESGQRRNQSWISHGNDQLEDIVEEKYKLHATIPSTSYNSHFQVLKMRNIDISSFLPCPKQTYHIQLIDKIFNNF